MELLLWRWSTTLQLASLVIIAAFFAVLLRSFGRAELKWWVAAWGCNFAALLTTLIFWAWRPSEAWMPLVKVLYMTPKTGFVLLLLHGAWGLKHPGGRLIRASWALPGLLVYSLVAAFLVNGIPLVGVTQTFVMGVLLTMGGTMLLARPTDLGLAWLSGGFFARAFVELRRGRGLCGAIQHRGHGRDPAELRQHVSRGALLLRQWNRMAHRLWLRLGAVRARPTRAPAIEW